MARPRALAAPRIASIALPDLEDGDPDTPRYDDRHDGERLSFAARSTASLADRTVTESELTELRLESLDARGCRLTDVVAHDVDIVTWDSHEASWRNIDLGGGRIGSLDLSGAELNSVLLRDLRIGYLDLRDATIQDVSIEGCVIGTLDLPSARVTRVGFRTTRIGELDLRMTECAAFDLRGAEVTDRFEIAGRTGRAPLEGVHASEAQLAALAPVLARHAGLTLEA